MNQNILKAIKNMVTQEVNQAGFDKTRTGTVLRANLDGTYSVRIDNRVYPNIPIITGYYCKQGDIVKITYPCGNSSQMYIASGRSNFDSTAMYEVGDIYITMNQDNPANRFGGEWERLEDRFLLGAGDTYALEATGGSKDAVTVSHTHTQTAHTHTTSVGNQSANHTHGTGSSTQGSFNIMQTAQMSRRRVQKGTQGDVMGWQWYTDNTANEDMYYVGSTQNTGINSANHTHTVSVSGGATTTGASGVSGVDQNMPPYIAVYIWRRIA